jgi:RNA polymerase sigma-70 factor, ECF subfamily
MAVEQSSMTSGAGIEQFGQLLAKCQRPVFLYAMSLLHNAADAEEVLQETNVVLWQKFEQYRPGTDFVRWAYGIAYYEVLKVREKQSRRHRLFSDDFFARLAVEAQEPSELLEARRQALTGCLQKLAERDRTLILHRYQPSATTRSLAETLGRSLQGTRKSLHRIRSMLLHCVQRTLSREGC